MDPASGAVLLRGSCVSSSSFISKRSYLCRLQKHCCSFVDCEASKELPDQTARSKQDTLPLVDAVKAAGGVDSVYPFHIPGHKVGGLAGLSARGRRIGRRLRTVTWRRRAEGPWSSGCCQRYSWTGNSSIRLDRSQRCRMLALKLSKYSHNSHALSPDAGSPERRAGPVCVCRAGLPLISNRRHTRGAGPCCRSLWC